MSNLFDDLRIYLPKYLSEEAQRDLYNELSLFPENLDKRFYWSHLKDEKTLFQGDGISEIAMVDYVSCKHRNVPGILISNTCDVSTENSRLFTPFLMFAPIFSLKKYQNGLLKQQDQDSNKVLSHIRSVREQKITSFFYLPSYGDRLMDDSFVRLDCIFNVPTCNVSIAALTNKRIFTLSNYGFYLFLLKLSIHFTRVHETIDRGIVVPR